ncbi:hypothetical protein ONZ45_g9844 [Pleurotus djamor]|nr:hypothetical protein ONZ45_g9844 [Pleurotus djamor]
MLTSFLALGKGWYGPVSGNWCWLVEKPPYLRYVLTHGWRYLFMLIEVGLSIYLHVYLRRHFRKARVPMVYSTPTHATPPSTMSFAPNPHLPADESVVIRINQEISQGTDAGAAYPGQYSHLDSKEIPAHLSSPNSTPTAKFQLDRFENPRHKAVQRILLLNAYPLFYIILWIPGLANRVVEASGHSSKVTQIMQASTQFVGLANALTLQPGNPDASPVLLQYLCNMFQRLYGFMPSYSSIERELGPASDFVTSALGSIRVTMDQETLINGIRRFDNFDLGQALHVMQYHPSSMMHAEFVRQGSIELVVDILKTLPTRALRESPEIQTFIISTIFQYLVKVYSLPHGKDHIQRAIECDIILALCDIAQRGHLRDPSAEFTKAAIQLFKILYSQIPFSHNLRIARKSIRPITLSEVSIVNHWSLIVSLVRYISPLQHTYKLTTGKVCNVRSDWDAVHRKLCPPEMAAHQPDGRWLTSINTDILKRSKEKITLLFQKYALINEQADRPPHVAISVNYFAHPITISSETIDEEYSENTKPEASLTDLLDVTTVIPMNASDNTVLKVELEQNLCPEPPYYTREEFLEQSVGDDDDLMKIRAEITRIEDILGETATQAGAGIPIVFEDSGDWDTGDISH